MRSISTLNILSLILNLLLTLLGKNHSLVFILDYVENVSKDIPDKLETTLLII